MRLRGCSDWFWSNKIGLGLLYRPVYLYYTFIDVFIFVYFSPSFNDMCFQLWNYFHFHLVSITLWFLWMPRVQALVCLGPVFLPVTLAEQRCDTISPGVYPSLQPFARRGLLWTVTPSVGCTRNPLSAPCVSKTIKSVHYEGWIIKKKTKFAWTLYIPEYILFLHCGGEGGS